MSGAAGRILVEGTAPAVQLTGFHRYLRERAHAHFSWAGEQTDLPATLPAVGRALAATANVRHRFALNDTNDGYTGPYRDWDYWEREIDVLALHGFNECARLRGGRRRLPSNVRRTRLLGRGKCAPGFRARAHQPWWLMQNMSAFGGPVSLALLDRRAPPSPGRSCGACANWA
ncbi:hypothetical protein GCM10020221_04610 [Streptomyces thioluteus]|uniref:Uncharacterized protein n=1 Tax=Streptomyces thioluteus TaxID=66431 RepID=A0ABN3WDC5_STRTU